MPIDFGGTDERVLIANESNFDQTTNLSMGAWVYREGSGTRQTWLSKGNGNASANGWLWDFAGFTAGEIEFFLVTNTDRFFNVGTPLAQNTWTHVCVVWDSGETGDDRLKIYTNGVHQAGATYTNNGIITTIEPNNLSVRLGINSSIINPWVGKVTEAFYYDVSLTDAEVAAIANSYVKYAPGQVSPSSLVACWPMDDGPDGTSADGDTVRDISGNGNTGTGDDGAENDLTWAAEEVLSYSAYTITPQSIAGAAPAAGFLGTPRGPFRGINRGIQRGVA